MKRRWMLAGLVLVAIVAIAVPALAGDSGGKQPRWLDATRIATASRTKAHHALGVARKARKRADRALKLAQQGAPVAPVAPAAIGAAFAEASGAQSTSSDTQFVTLPGGPSLTVNVPRSANAPSGTGFIQVAASARVGDEGGAVSLFEDGSPVAGQGDLCQTIAAAPDPTLFVSVDTIPGVYATPGTPDFITGGCASGAPAPVYFTTTTGTHSYELRYLYCGCSGTEATFSERRLWVTPLG
jgi:hypothetical protein